MKTIVYFGLCFFLIFAGCSSGSSSDSDTEDTTTRDLTGNVVQASIPLPSLRANHGTLYQSTTDCSDVQICCNGYDGSTAVETVASDCSFTISLPINSYCFCGLFTGEDADGDGCFDDYIGSLGCSEGGYSGAIPIFADADGSTDDIDSGDGEVQGTRVVSSTDICSQVDQDSDGTADSDDSDDDGDDVADDDDNFNSEGCESVAELDSDGNDIPDIFEDLWEALFGSDSDDFFFDEDEDDVPDGCDEEVGGTEFSCAADELDTDGDCIDDEFDESLEDNDEDGLIAYIDCDDDDADVGFECYEEAFCALDIDEDGVSYCDDCDDYDSNETRSYDECDSDSVSCSISSCDTDFDCESVATDYIAEGNPLCIDEESVSCIECIDGCCEVTE